MTLNCSLKKLIWYVALCLFEHLLVFTDYLYGRLVLFVCRSCCSNVELESEIPGAGYIVLQFPDGIALQAICYISLYSADVF